MHHRSIERLMESFGIKIKEKKYYYKAITHPSFSNEHKEAKDYQRLEFLGDAILGKLVAERLFFKRKNLNEGEMSIIRSNAVNGKRLAQFSKEMGLHELIHFGNVSENLKENNKILEDVFEAIVAAIYIDHGEHEVKKFLANNVFAFIDTAHASDVKNPKTILQEYLQAESRENIVYETQQEKDNFVSEVFHEGHSFGKGRGHTKKEAEVDAAKHALKLLSINKKGNNK